MEWEFRWSQLPTSEPSTSALASLSTTGSSPPVLWERPEALDSPQTWWDQPADSEKEDGEFARPC